jgi:hypothetical protein
VDPENCPVIVGLLLLHRKLQQALSGERPLTESEEKLVDDVLREFERIQAERTPQCSDFSPLAELNSAAGR